MTIDDRARAASTAVLDHVDRLDVPDVAPMVRRVGRRRVLTAAGAIAVVLAAIGVGAVAAAHDPAVEPPVEPRPGVVEGWTRVDKADAGLPPGSSLTAVDADDDTAVLAGGVSTGDPWQAAAWWTEDGLTWHEADHPTAAGEVFAVAIHDGVALAVGSAGTPDDLGGSDFVWRSDDGGRTWAELVVDEDLFGPAAPEMGRPFVGQLVWFDGQWVASGGSSTGYAAIWTSPDGEGWTQVLETEEGGSVSLSTGDGRLIAYTGHTVWTTDDPADWGEPSPMSVPGDHYVSSMASGGDFAIGQSEAHHQVQQLLHAVEPWQWAVAPAFDGAYGGQTLFTTERFDDLYLVTGADGQGRPTAWTKVGPSDDWTPIPSELRGEPGGVLGLTTELGDRVIALGTAPELDRYYVFDRPTIDEPTPGVPTVPPEEQAIADQLAASTPGSMAWFRLKLPLPGFDPARATVGVTTLGQLVPFLSPVVAQNVDTLDPADYGVATTDEIPVAVGVYRGEPGDFEGYGGEGARGDTLMIATTVQPNGPETRSVDDGSRLEGIEAVLTPV